MRLEARKHLIQDATIHVRLTKKLMGDLMDYADEAALPLSVLVRQWIEEKLADKPTSIDQRLTNIESELRKLRREA